MAGPIVVERGQISIICRFQKNIVTLVSIATSLVAVYVINQLIGQPSWNLSRLIDLDGEGNLPTWFSNAVWMLVAGAAFYVAITAELRDRIKSRFWKIAGLIFLGFSCDEVARFHERLGKVFSSEVFQVHLHWSPWIVFFGPFIVVGAAVFLRAIYMNLKADSKACRKVLLGLGLFLFAAFFMELTVFFFNRNLHMRLYFGEVVLEEYFEMLGAILIFSGILDYAQKVTGRNSLAKTAVSSMDE